MTLKKTDKSVIQSSSLLVSIRNIDGKSPLKSPKVKVTVLDGTST